MWRVLKLLTNLVLSSFVFNYYITILVILLNPFELINDYEFLILFLDMYVFYGPLWVFSLWILFYFFQFFSENKFNIGILSPPTLTYFFFFSVFVSSLVIYLNYDYYLIQFPKTIQSIFIEILLVNLVIIISSIIFIFSKNLNKKWIHSLALFILIISFINTYNTVQTKKKLIKGYEADLIKTQKDEPRKIRIVIMNGLSLSVINNIKSEQNLLNFNFLLKNGVAGNIDLFKPNLDVSLLNTAFTGKLPSSLPYHSNYKFKFRNINKEFNVFPRYIFFRYSSKLKFSFFYKKNREPIINQISQHYIQNGFKIQSLINPIFFPSYFSKNLKTNTKYIKHFSEINKHNKDIKYKLLKKSIFYDTYIKSRILDLKDSDFFFSVIQFKGLDTISKYFYQFYMSHIFGNIDKDSITKYKWVLEKYYEFYDSIIGNLISTTGDDELLIILSLYEYEPLPVWRRILANLLGNREIYMYKSLNSKGSIFLYEKNAIKKGYPLQTMSIIDFFPTMLYYSRFNLSNNMKGNIIREIFLDNFLLNNPIEVRTGSKNTNN